MIVTIAELIAFFWLLAFAAIGVTRLARGEMKTVWVTLIAVFMLFGLPLILDQVFGRPTYYRFPGLRWSSEDQFVRVMYCIYMIICPPIVLAVQNWRFLPSGGTQDYRSVVEDFGGGIAKIRPLLLGFSILPIVLVFVSPSPNTYLTYATIYERFDLLSSGVSNEEFARFHVFVTTSCLLSTIAVGLLLSIQRKAVWITCIFIYLPILIANAWIIGKRSSVALGLCMLLLGLWANGKLRGYRVAVAGVVCFAILMTFSMWYQGEYRGQSTITFSERYDGMRIDYGRDHTVRLALYSSAYPGLLSITSYPGESVVSDLTSWIPRGLWPDKPSYYAKMVTIQALGGIDTPINWGITTSLLDEAIANFSVFGLLIGPLVLGLICRVGDSKGPGWFQVFTMLITILLLTLHIPAIIEAVAMWAVCVILVPNRGGPNATIQISEVDSAV